jgi:hypothetical protein
MAEPISTTGVTTAATSLGLIALLTGWVGAVEADVIMVVFASLFGSMLSLSNGKQPIKGSMITYSMNVGISIVGAWFLAGLIVDMSPSVSSIYLPSIIAFGLSFGSDRIAKLLNLGFDKAEEKAGLK